MTPKNIIFSSPNRNFSGVVSCGLCVNGVNCFVSKTEVLVFPDLCSNEVNCFITKTEILLNLLLRGGEMSKRFAL